jgi:hypothetical protein
MVAVVVVNLCALSGQVVHFFNNVIITPVLKYGHQFYESGKFKSYS